jgi:hypothetical protein
LVGPLSQSANAEPVPPRQLAPATPRDLETVCLKCLQKDPRQRYASAAELAEELRRYRAGEPIVARPAGILERAVKWVRRPVVAGLTAGLVLVTVLGVAGILWKYAEAEHNRDDAVRLAGDLKDKRDEALGLAENRRKAVLRANDKTAEALRQRDRAEGLLYAANLLHAVSFWGGGNASAAHDRLEACRPDYRGWEHAHLRHRFEETSATLRGHTGKVNGLCFSPDGKQLASAGGDRTVKVWDVASGRELLTLRGHTDWVSEVTYCRAGAAGAASPLPRGLGRGPAAAVRLRGLGHRGRSPQPGAGALPGPGLPRRGPRRGPGRGAGAALLVRLACPG